ncbi:MAG: penicillin-binding transpeptidase domain-containing protein [Lachnospiraceae bacterium]
MKRKRIHQRSHEGKSKIIPILLLIVVISILAVLIKIIVFDNLLLRKPKDLLTDYMSYIENQEFDKMYEMLSQESKTNIDKETYITRNSKIYEGIEIQNLVIQNVEEIKLKNKKRKVMYDTSFYTVAGQVSFKNEVLFKKEKDGYRLLWEDSLIFPGLERTDKVRVSTETANRGQILDRNGVCLAGPGLLSSVGIVPAKFQNEEETLEQLSQLLDLTVDTIKNKLQASWVKEDSFVPIATIPKLSELENQEQSEEEISRERERQNKLLAIPGVMMTDTKTRTYKLGKAAAQLVGYMQNATEEDLEKYAGEGYSLGSMIGKSGVEAYYEKKLRGQNGCKIFIVAQDGQEKEVIVSTKKEDGQDIKLTIDAELQQDLYEKFEEDPGCSVAMNPYTGEVLALVSTPTYDSNDFIRGISGDKWKELSEDEKKPLYNRFRQIWAPGSTFKPITGAIGLKTGVIDANENFGSEGLSWQKDNSWGSYHVTTLHTYAPVILKNALIYSDNIYFAKTALRIGAENFAKQLEQIGFNQQIPFEINMSNSKYSNTEKIESEIQLADSGYGQGQILVNPLHLASMYTAFCNDGSIIKPYLEYKENEQKEVWISDMFSSDVVSQVREGLIGVINNPNGTGYAAFRGDKTLAGKTGTAELKATKEDTTGTEIGWFCVFTADKEEQNPILLVSMVENVKNIGGSGYVVRKDKAVLDNYFAQ